MSHTADLPRALGGPAGSGQGKLAPEDFVVEEVLGFSLSGSGEHLFLRIEKQGENTEYVARRLARHAGVPVRNVGYAGLKDRHGRTIQWFSVQLPGQADPDWAPLESANLRILETGRNQRKLRTGAAAGNRFRLTLRDLRVDPGHLTGILDRIGTEGIPNYFGDQRFGHAGQNLDRALDLFAGRGERPSPYLRGLYLSAARAEVFNRILALRVARGSWNLPLPGDAFMFQGSRSFFTAAAIDDDIRQRVASHAIHPAGTLWGRDLPAATTESAALEQAATAECPALCQGLEALELEVAKRPLRVCPEDFRWDIPEPATLRLDFVLPAGAYATAVVRELLDADFHSLPQ